MKHSPFIDDPRDAFRKHVAEAVSSTLPEAAILHIGLAEHHAALARESGLALPPRTGHQATAEQV